MQGKESWFGSLALGKNPWKKRKRLSTPRLRPEEFHSDRIKWLWQINHETKYHKSLKNKQTYKPSTTKLSQEFKKQIYKPYSTQTYPNQTPSEEKKKNTPQTLQTLLGPTLLLLLLLNRFSRARLCAAPYTATQQAPRSLEFSRQEHWCGLLLSSPTHGEKWKRSRSVVPDATSSTTKETVLKTQSNRKVH